MMCASELAIVRNAAVMKWEKEKAESLARLVEASVSFCENTIGPELEKQALNPKGGLISTSVELASTTDNYGNEVLCPIRYDGKKYANGDLSYSPCKDKCYGRAFIEQYLHDHCLSVRWEDTTYNRYGCGSCHAYKLIVEVK